MRHIHAMLKAIDGHLCEAVELCAISDGLTHSSRRVWLCHVAAVFPNETAVYRATVEKKAFSTPIAVSIRRSVICESGTLAALQGMSCEQALKDAIAVRASRWYERGGTSVLLRHNGIEKEWRWSLFDSRMVMLRPVIELKSRVLNSVDEIVDSEEV